VKIAQPSFQITKFFTNGETEIAGRLFQALLHKTLPSSPTNEPYQNDGRSKSKRPLSKVMHLIPPKEVSLTCESLQ
jgi:hypothetical protein